MREELFEDLPRREYLDLLHSHLEKYYGMKRVGCEVWEEIEDGLGVKLPSAYKAICEVVPAGSFGYALEWFSPLYASDSYYLLDAQKIKDMSEGFFGNSDVPLYPLVPGYFIFAYNSVEIYLSFKVVKNSGLNLCEPEVFLLDLRTGDFEQAVESTDLGVDELLYRGLTNKPPLTGVFSQYLFDSVTSNPEAPQFSRL